MTASIKKYLTAFAATAVLALGLYGCGGGGGGGPMTGGEMMMPDDGDTMMPDDGDTMMPDDGDTMMPDDGDTMMPDDGDTMMPDDGDTMMPDDGDTMMPDDGDTMMPDDGDAEIIDLSELLIPAIEQGTAPGMIAAVIDERGVRAIGAAGLRRQGSPEMITVDDLVHIGSDTKAMTSTMLATLVEDGIFSNGWNTTIADVFPELTGTIHQDYHTVTLSQLVRMRGGIAQNAADWRAHSSNPDIVRRRYEILRDNLASPPAGPVGDDLYSNLSYMVAGAMAEQLTGKSWETLMQERLFAPLGITNAGFGPPGTPGAVDQPWGHRSDGSGGWTPNQYDNDAALGPAGTVHISIEDWAKFISLWFTNKEPAILNRSILDELSAPEAGNYAAGWGVFQQDWAGGTTIGHDGSNTEWYATLLIAPSLGVAYLAVANSSDTYEDRGVVSSLYSIISGLIADDSLSRGAGGGGSGQEESSQRQWLLDPASVRSVTGAQAPGFSNEDISGSVSGLNASANALLASDLLLLADGGAAVRSQTTCLNGECSLEFSGTTLTRSTTDVEFGDTALEYQAVASHRGVSLAEGRGGTSIAGTSIDYNAYGGWLQHSFFVIEAGKVAEGLLKGTPIIHGYSVGDAPNTNPEAAGGSGTWTGVMVGADVSQTSTRGNLIQGNAEITIADFADPEADITFTQIFDLNTETQRADMTWSGIEVTDGGFASGADGNSIEGRFYGSNHEEVGGIFERDQVLGAFGGARSSSGQ